MNKLLPLGTVVKLNDSQELMIIGYFAKEDNSSNQIYDYIGCNYPFGFDNKNHCLFNRESIKSISFVGYQTKELSDVRKVLCDFYNNQDLSDEEMLSLIKEKYNLNIDLGGQDEKNKS